MPSLDSQAEYWNSTGVTKTFGHPLEPSWLHGIAPEAYVLDYGCGYGRLAGLLSDLGFCEVEGIDVAANLIARAREERPESRFTVLTQPPYLPHEAETVDIVLLFAVLTCMPTDAGQHELLGQLWRVLRPGGLVYVSDLCLQQNQRDLDRYAAFASRYGTYGVFETEDGAVCRHHSMDWLYELFGDFDVVRCRNVPVNTMNGRSVTAVQFLLRRP